MTARQQVVLTCDTEEDCSAAYTAPPGRTITQARDAAQGAGWTSDRHRADRCPEHPWVAPVVMGGLMIRLYDTTGHLLYVASTTKRTPGMRVRTLRAAEDWWPAVDPARTLVEQVPADVDLFAEREDIARREKPRFYRDEYGKYPYLHNTKIIEPNLRGTPLSRLRTKRGSGGGDTESQAVAR